MSITYDWPVNDPAFDVSSADFWLEDTDVSVKSVLGGGMQTSGVPGAHWMGALVFPKDRSDNRLKLHGFLRRLNGKEHRINLWDLRKFSAAGVSGEPRGTINTTGVTVNANAGQFATSLSLAGCGNAKTLEYGDMLSVGGQLIESCEQYTASAGGVITVLVPQRLRKAAFAGDPVTLVKPRATFFLTGPFHAPRGHALYDSFAIDVQEFY